MNNEYEDYMTKNDFKKTNSVLRLVKSKKKQDKNKSMNIILNKYIKSHIYIFIVI